jgi:hypothetical protein
MTEARATWERARGDEVRLKDLATVVAAAKIGDREMRAIRAAHQASASAIAALDAASAIVRVRALRPISIDGSALGEGEERSIKCDDDTRLSIDGVAEIFVSPGARGLDALRDAADDTARSLREKLDACGATNAAEAESRYGEHLAALAQLEQAKSIFKVVAPKGIAQIEEVLRASEAKYAALGDDDANAPAIDDAEAALALTQDALRERRSGRDESNDAHARAREDASQAKHAKETWKARHAEIQKRLDGEPADAIANAANNAMRAWMAAEELRTSLEEEHRRGGGDDAATDLERESRAFDQRQKDRALLHDRSIELRALITRAGADDLHGEVQRASSDRGATARTFTRIKARADAIDLLKRTLDETRRELQERLVAPVLDRVHPYLVDLFPRAKLKVSEGWEILGLENANIAEDFDALSFGAKEQVSILVRLALAEVLGENESLPIILDDCLVNTDPERHDAMIRVLYRASRKQQIILFSCNQRAFDRLGETRRIELSPRRR